MKFISKSTNLRIVLQHGMPAEPLTGRAAVAGLYIKFENGVVDVSDETTIKLMLSHPAFNSDFIKADDDGVDPYADRRIESEPEHDMTEIKYGAIGKALNPKKGPPLTMEQKSAVTKMAKELAIKMAPTIAKQMLEEMKEDFIGKDKKTVSTTIDDNVDIVVEKGDRVETSIDDFIKPTNDIPDQEIPKEKKKSTKKSTGKKKSTKPTANK